MVPDHVVVICPTHQYSVAPLERLPQGGERGIVFNLEDLTGGWTYIIREPHALKTKTRRFFPEIHAIGKIVQLFIEREVPVLPERPLQVLFDFVFSPVVFLPV